MDALGRFIVIDAIVAGAGVARADEVPLYSFIFVHSGQATCSDNRPLMLLADATYCLGANCPGIWSSQPIQFGDAGVQANGLGQHPGLPRPCRAEFNLDAIRISLGCPTISSFSARAGIERFSQPGAGANGATMRVYLDGVVAFSVNLADGFSPSVGVSLPLDGVHSLLLETQTLGAWGGNNACWGNAVLTLTPGCVADVDDGTGVAVGECDGSVDINDLLFFLSAFERGEPYLDLDDGSGTGTHDGGFDISDLLFFLAHFEVGC